MWLDNQTVSHFKTLWSVLVTNGAFLILDAKPKRLIRGKYAIPLLLVPIMLAIGGGLPSLLSSTSSPQRRRKPVSSPLPAPRAWMKMQRETQLDWQMSLKSVMLPDMATKKIVPGAGAQGNWLHCETCFGNTSSTAKRIHRWTERCLERMSFIIELLAIWMYLNFEQSLAV